MTSTTTQGRDAMATALRVLLTLGCGCGDDDGGATGGSSDAATADDDDGGDPSSGSDDGPDPDGSSSTAPDDGDITTAADETGPGDACIVEPISTFEASCAFDPEILVAGDHAAVVSSLLSPFHVTHVRRLDAELVPADEPVALDVARETQALRVDGTIAVVADDASEETFAVLPLDEDAPTLAAYSTDLDVEGARVVGEPGGWTLVLRHRVFDRKTQQPDELVELRRFDDAGEQVGAPEQLDALGDDTGFHSVLIVPHDDGTLVAWNDFVDDAGEWRLDARRYDSGESPLGDWSTPLAAVLACGWASGDTWVLCARELSEGHVEYRELESGALVSAGFDGGTSAMVVDAAPRAQGAAALTMEGGFGDGGPTTLSVSRLDDALQPLAEPIVVDTDARRAAFDIAVVGDVILVVSCAFDADTMTLWTVTCS